MSSYIYITSSGYDPERGKHLSDPYLGNPPTFGACMPNIRRHVVEGDQIFVVSGKVKSVPQYVIAGFEVAETIDAMTAYNRFPELRLHEQPDGQVDGNIIVTDHGTQHPLDTHKPESFETRIQNYIVGRDPIVLTTPYQVERGRIETLDMLRYILQRPGVRPFDVIGRCKKLNEQQALELRHWLSGIKHTERE